VRLIASLSITTVVYCASAAAAGSQVATGPSPIPTTVLGQRVRVCEASTGRRFTGVLVAATLDSFQLARQPDSIHISRYSVATVERSRGRRRLYDAAWATPLGAFAGGLLGYMIGERHDRNQPREAAFYGTGGTAGMIEGAVGGGLLAAFVGGWASPERWELVATQSVQWKQTDRCGTL
jgi:hypothetical protein